MEDKDMKKAIKNAKELLENSKSFVVTSENGCALVGSTSEILTLVCELINNCKDLKGVNKDILKAMTEIGLMTEEERLEKLKEDLEEMKNIIKGDN